LPRSQGLTARGLREEVMGNTSAGESAWRISRKCESGACVEVGTVEDSVIVRNSADPDGAYFTFGRGEWQVFIARFKSKVPDSL
jgi:hypothetical protein